MSSTGRNDPCPCGSGQKYKRCCGAATRPAIDVHVTEDDRAAAHDVLERITRSERYASQVDAAVQLLCDDEDWSEDFEVDLVAGWFVEWLSFDVPLDRRFRTAADHALASHAGTLSPGARLFIDQMRCAPLRLVQVQTVFFASNVLLCRDQLDPPARYRVMDDGGFERHDLVAARIVERRGLLFFEGSPALILTDNRRRLVRHILRVRRKAVESGAPPPLVRMIEGAALVRVMADSEATLTGGWDTAEGDPIEPTRVMFRVIDVEALARALDGATDFITERDPSGWVFTWMPKAESGSRSFAVGHGVVEGDSIDVRTLSRRRAERVRDRLMAVAGAAVAFLDITEAPTEATTPPRDSDRHA
jgi:SEC-C motif-containing protein